MFWNSLEPLEQRRAAAGQKFRKIKKCRKTQWKIKKIFPPNQENDIPRAPVYAPWPWFVIDFSWLGKGLFLIFHWIFFVFLVFLILGRPRCSGIPWSPGSNDRLRQVKKSRTSRNPRKHNEKSRKFPTQSRKQYTTGSRLCSIAVVSYKRFLIRGLFLFFHWVFLIFLVFLIFGRPRCSGILWSPWSNDRLQQVK